MSDTAILYEIIMNCEYIRLVVDDINADHDKFISGKFNKDRELCAFLVGQIGEYVNQLTKEIKGNHPEVLWHQIVALRNRIVHDYRSVNYELLWKISITSIPELKGQCLRILRELDPNASTDIQEEIESLRSNNGGD